MRVRGGRSESWRRAGRGLLAIVTLLMLAFTLGNTAHSAAAGPRSVRFNGSTQLISVPNTASLQVKTNVTLEAWFKPNAISGPKTIAGKNDYELTIYQQGGGVRVQWEFSVAGGWRACVSGTISTGAWHHAAGTYDGATMRLFVDGILVDAAPVTGNIDQTTKPFYIASADGAGDLFAGNIDEVRLSNTVRYTTNFAVATGPFAPDAFTAGLWHLDDATGTTATDSSANANTGSLKNGPTWSIDVPFSGAPDITPPVITNVRATNVSAAIATVTWTTDEPASTRAEWGLTPSYGATTPLAAGLITAHSVALSGLSPGGTYHYRVLSRDAAGNLAASPDSSFTTATGADTTPPVFSGIQAVSVTAGGATISWVTNEASSTQAQWGPTMAYGTSGALDSTLTTTHAVGVTGLAPGQTYHYRVLSRDAAGNLATSGDYTFTTLANGAAAQGQWSSVNSWPIVAVHSALLYTGEVLLWDAWQKPTQVRLWNPATNAMRDLSYNDGLFCSGHSQLADGRLLVVGGHDPSTGDAGIRSANIFDPANGTWTKAADLNDKRWYPSTSRLGDGRLVTISGEAAWNVWSDTPEVYDPAANTWTRINTVSTSDLHEDEYPLAFLVPDGRIFTLISSTAESRFFDVANGTWLASGLGATPAPNGSATMYAPGKILVTGGGQPPGGASTTNAAVVDLTAPNPAWRTIAPMNFPRYMHNLTVLPDGKVLAVGGAKNLDQNTTLGTLPAEIWDPATEVWSVVASESQPRMYHSTSTLLPDGRVLVAGGGRYNGSTDYLTSEIYSPPYLFQGARPAVTNAPANAAYTSSISVTTPDAASIAKVTLASLGSVTHSLDMDQHFTTLSFSASGNTLTVQAPANGNIAPPGYYMLFIVNSAGVPSVATMIRLTADATPPTVSISSPSVGDRVSGNVSISANAADNLGVANVQFMVDGAAIGSRDSAAPYSVVWNSASVANGDHALSARATDVSGNSTVSVGVLVTVANAADTTPPVITGTAAVTVGATSAIVTWVTNEPSTSQVDYGTTAGFGTSTALDPSLVTSHSQQLFPLQASTTYFCQVKSRDAAGNLGTSGTFQFSTVASSGPFIGTTAVQSSVDENPAGMAEAFQYTATASGSVTTLAVYVDASNTATKIVVGLYRDTGGNNPGALIVQGTITNPVAGAWNSVAVAPSAVTNGTMYWIAILGPAGSGIARFRDVPTSGGGTQSSASSSLAVLPAVWTTGTLFGSWTASAWAGP